MIGEQLVGLERVDQAAEQVGDFTIEVPGLVVLEASRVALEQAGVAAPVTSALGRLISGELPLQAWVALVRTTVPPPALWRRRPRPGFWRRLWRRLSGRA